MALRNVRIDGDPILRKTSKEIKEVTEKIRLLAEDMFETMDHEKGVGLAAPQIGILKRIVVIDSGEENERFALINPVIQESEGSQIATEGCLSIPNFTGYVDRPEKLRVSYLNLQGDEKEIKAEGFLARIICHELDHLDGVLFKDKVELVPEEDDIND